MKLFSIVFVFLSLCVLNKDVHSSQDSKQAGKLNTKIVSAGGSVTEILFALEMDDKIVAVDTSSLYPEKARQLPKVGYYRQLSPEGVISTGATFLLAMQGAGPSTGLEQMQSAGIETTVFNTSKTIDGLFSLIKQIGNAVHEDVKAAALIEKLKNDINTLKNYKYIDKASKVVFLMSVSDRGLMAAGKNSVPNTIINEIGATNPFAEFEGYKQLSIEALLSADPDLILLPSHNAQGLNAQQLCQSHALKLYSRLKSCNLKIVDSLMYLGLTPRLPMAMREVQGFLAEQENTTFAATQDK